MPRTDALVIVLVVAIVVATNNLAYGVIVGLVLTAIFFAVQMSKIGVETHREGGVVTYVINGQIFFASTEPLLNAFDFHDSAELVILDFSQAHLWDESAAAALQKSIHKFKSCGKQVKVRGLDENSVTLVRTLYGKAELQAE